MKLIRCIGRLYNLTIVRSLVVAYRDHDNSLKDYLYWFWHTRSYRTAGKLRPLDKPLVVLLGATALSQIVSGIALIIDWVRFGTAGEWAFGVAVLISYPIVIAHLLLLGIFCKRLAYFISHPKKLGREIVASALEHQVKVLRRKHHFKVVAVAGSVGKTTTKLAIAELLGQNMRVRYQDGNYNDRITVPLVFFGKSEPRLLDVLAWCRIIGDNTASINHPYPYDVVVVELGTDHPGQMKSFAYLKPDITVLTAVTPEHMEFFKSLDAVAEEELTIFDYSDRVLVNGDNTPAKYLIGREFDEYSVRTNAARNYYAVSYDSTLSGQDLQVSTPSGTLHSTVGFVGVQGAVCCLAAIAVADMLGMPQKDILDALPTLKPYSGRMQVFEGVKGSTIIDDTYNASPVAVKAALDVLYAAKAKQRMAILGSMNELGSFSKAAHIEVGQYCDPHKLDLVATIGRDAERWLAPAARNNGCVVHCFDSPVAAASFVIKQLKKDAVVLVKGSQNRVFAEEAVKHLLAHPGDVEKLVRQSPDWLKIKAKQFND